MPFVERRAFPRQPIDHLTVLRLRDETAIAARIVEVSARGARVELDRRLPEGTYVRLTLQEQIVFGHVCYCVPGQDNEFALGIELAETLAGVDDLAKLSRHLAVSEGSGPKNTGLQPNGANAVIESAKEPLPKGLG